MLRSRPAMGLVLALLLLQSVPGLRAQTVLPRLTGKVVDSTGAVMQAVDVRVYRGKSSSVVKAGKTDGAGEFALELAAGEYRLEVEAPDFETAKRTVQVTAAMKPVEIELKLASVVVEIEVATDDGKVSVDPDSGINGITVSPDEIADLPDNNDDLAAFLKQLASSMGGAFDIDSELAEFVIDGLPGGELPSKEQILSIRIIEDLSAEGGRRIEIVTKAGTGPWHGNSSFGFRDSALNASQPLSDRPKPQNQNRSYTSTFSGPVIQNKLGGSFSLRSSKAEEGSQSIRAITPLGGFSDTVISPTISHEFSMSNLKWDIVAGKHSMTFSGSIRSERRENGGVSGFNLPERATNNESRRWVFQVSQNSTLGKWVNLWRIQVNRNRSETSPIVVADPIVQGPIAVNVQDAFYGGSSPNRSFSRSTNFILSNQLSTTLKKWTFKGSVQLNRNHPFSDSENNYRGTYTFASLHDYCVATFFYGGNCAETEAIWDDAMTAGVPPTYYVADGSGSVSPRTITGIPTQFTQVQGDPALEQHITTLQSQLNADWRKSQKMSLSVVLKHQIENYLHHLGNVSPTLTWRYMVLPKTTVTMAGNVTMNSFSGSAYEQILRSDGQSHQQNIVISNPDYVAGDVPYNGALNVAAQSTTIRKLSSNYEDPYNVQTQMQLARQLPRNMAFSVNFSTNRGFRQTRYRNINAPYPGTALSDDLLSRLNAIPNSSCDTACTQTTRDAARAEVNAMRPDPLAGNILQYESTGRSSQKALSFALRINNLIVLKQVKLSVNPNLNFRWAHDSPGTLVNSWDLTEWGRASGDQRVQFRTPINLNWFPARKPIWQFTTNFTLNVNSGRPYNITTGRDDNGDTVNNDRPAGVARNSATGPGNYNVDMTFSKRFYLRQERPSRPSTALVEPGEPQRGGGGGFGGGGFGGGGNGSGNRNGNGNSGGQNGRRSMTLQVQVQNLLNNTQLRPPSGVVTSRFFGQSTTAAQGRQIVVNMQMSLF